MNRFRPLVCLLCFFPAHFLLAQQAPTPPPPLPTDQDGYEMKFDNVPMPQIVLEYEQLTGKRIVVDQNVQAGTMSINTSGKMPRAEAARFIEKSLLLNGYAFVPSGDDTLTIIAYESAKKPASEGVPFYYNEIDIPEGDSVISFILPLKYLDPEDAVNTIKEIVPPHPYGSLVVVPNTQAFVVTENSSVVRRIIQITRQLDVAPSRTIQRSFALTRADATEIAEVLSELLGLSGGNTGSNQTATIPPPPQPVANMANQQNQRPGEPPLPTVPGSEFPVTPSVPTTFRSNSIEASAGEPRIQAITRTNKILVMARPSDMEYIAALIEELDAPSEYRNFISRPLRYLSVTEVLPVLQNALLQGNTEDGAAVASGEQDSTRPGQGGQSNITQGGGQGGFGGGNNDFGGGGASMSQVSLGEPTKLGAPQSVVVGKTLIIADPIPNELFVSGPPEQLEVVGRLLDQMDKPPKQIYLSVVTGQLTLTDDFEFGVDWLRTVQDVNVRGNQTLVAGIAKSRDTAARGIVNVANLSNVAAFLPAAQGLTLYGAIGDHLNVYVSALENTNRFRVLNRPTLFALNNTKAVVATGQRVAIPVSSLSSLNPNDNNNLSTSVTSNIQYQDVVLKIEIIPRITNEGEITLQIAQGNDDIIGNTVINGNEVPTIGTTSMSTTVVVPDRKTIMLGGLISESTERGEKGIPILNKIPILKYLAGTTKDSTTRRELLVFIQPRIVNNATDMEGVQPELTQDVEVATPAKKLLSQQPLIYGQPQPMYQPLPVIEAQTAPKGPPKRTVSDRLRYLFRKN
jgi:general secretion pathway protein D